MGGRRIFANTMKYLLMGTSSNFGNMFSAAGASIFLKFLPMLPSQILLNNLLYDTGQLAIPTDEVDPELVAQPTRWDIGFIRKFMIFFGPISSIFDFITFGIMLWVFHAGEALFQTGWFVESLATQTLVIFVIRTRRVPFFRSVASAPMALAAVGLTAIGAVLPYTGRLAHILGFRPLPATFFFALAGIVVVYLVLVETGKYGSSASTTLRPRPRPGTVGAATACTAGPAASPPAPSARPAAPILTRQTVNCLRRPAQPAFRVTLPVPPWAASTGPLPLPPRLLRPCTHGMKSWLPATQLAGRAPPRAGEDMSRHRGDSNRS